jgi:hypothetical protein
MDTSSDVLVDESSSTSQTEPPTTPTTTNGVTDEQEGVDGLFANNNNNGQKKIISGLKRMPFYQSEFDQFDFFGKFFKKFFFLLLKKTCLHLYIKVSTFEQAPNKTHTTFSTKKNLLLLITVKLSQLNSATQFLGGNTKSRQTATSIFPNSSQFFQIHLYFPNSSQFSKIHLNFPKFISIFQNSSQFSKIHLNFPKFISISPNSSQFFHFTSIFQIHLNFSSSPQFSKFTTIFNEMKLRMKWKKNEFKRNKLHVKKGRGTLQSFSLAIER